MQMPTAASGEAGVGRSAEDGWSGRENRHQQHQLPENPCVPHSGTQGPQMEEDVGVQGTAWGVQGGTWGGV